jgi:hypothetical protein
MSDEIKTTNPLPSNTAFIRYPRLKELHQEIQRCQELSKVSSEPQCMSLEGSSGAGKTTLVRDYAAMFPRYQEEGGIAIPVFYAEIPSPATVKGTASSLLEQLGDPGAHKGTLWSMNSRLVGLIKDCGVELVILDEFSNLIDTETNHILNTVSDWLKMLIKQTGVPFMVVGIEGKVEQILNANAQLSRLFAFRETLEPFRWSDKNSIDEFALFLQYAERAIGISLTNEMPKAELYYRVFYATNGVVGNIMNLIRYAGLLATEKQSQTVELEHLSLAFVHRIGKHLRNKTNPFTYGANDKFVAPIKNGKFDEGKSEMPKLTSALSATLTTR